MRALSRSKLNPGRSLQLHRIGEGTSDVACRALQGLLRTLGLVITVAHDVPNTQMTQVARKDGFGDQDVANHGVGQLEVDDTFDLVTHQRAETVGSCERWSAPQG